MGGGEVSGRGVESPSWNSNEPTRCANILRAGRAPACARRVARSTPRSAKRSIALRSAGWPITMPSPASLENSALRTVWTCLTPRGKVVGCSKPPAAMLHMATDYAAVSAPAARALASRRVTFRRSRSGSTGSSFAFNRAQLWGSTKARSPVRKVGGW